MLKTTLTISAAIVLLIGCGTDKQQTKKVEWMSDEAIDLSSSQLMTDESTLGTMPKYSDIKAGKSERIERSFENAPPLIPHKVGNKELIITKEHNECLKCHMPDKAEEKKSTPIPKSHFTNYRPDIVERDGLFLVDANENQIVANDLGNNLNSAMFNCTLCHAPQSKATLEVDNVFTAEFRNSDDKSRSNLSEVIGEGVN